MKRLIVAGVLVASAAAWADDVYWTGEGDGVTWNSAANWNPQQVPTAADNAIFEKAATLSDTVNVLGRMTVRSGAAVTATETVLGGAAGCCANLLVTGSGSKFESLKKVTIGCAAGGTGKLVTENGGTVFIYQNDCEGLIVAKGAVPAEGDVIDVLDIGDAQSRIAFWNNQSSYPARVRFTSATSSMNIATASSSWYSQPFKSANWVFAADAPAVASVYLAQLSNFTYYYTLAVEGTGAFNLYLGGTAAPYYCYLDLRNKGGFSLANAAPLTFSKGHVNMEEMLGQLTVANALNVNGNAVFADGLTVTASGSLTATAADSFTFGTADRDGVLSAAIPAKAPVTKVGAGTLTVTGASSAGDFVLSGGTLKVAASTSLASLTMEAGTTLVVDGADLTLGNLVQHGSVTVSTVNGGRILYGGSALTEVVRPTLGGDFVKVGSATTTIYEPASVPSSLHVSEGELAFSKYGLAQRYWKWTFKGIANGPSPLKSFGKLWLFGADGERVGEGLECAAYHVHNVDLTSKDSYKGKATWLCDPSTNVVGSSDSWQDCDTKIANLFVYNAAQNNFPYLKSPVIDENNPASYLGFEFRFRDTDGPITGYNFGLTTTGSGRPSDWTVEVSDDGKAWTTVDVRSDVTLPPNTYGIFWDGTIYKSNETPNPPPAETFHFTGYLREGLEPLATPLSVQVDEDAKLNLKAFTGGQSVGTLTYDAALGAGEIENAVFAANGTLYYTSVSGKPKTGTMLPYVLTDCSGLENLATWSVVINGKATSWRVSTSGGQITLIAPGTFIVVK